MNLTEFLTNGKGKQKVHQIYDCNSMMAHWEVLLLQCILKSIYTIIAFITQDAKESKS